MKILYFGPIAEVEKPAVGGYEAANRKNIDKIRDFGNEVVEFPYPVINHKLGALGKVAYIKLFFLPLKLFKYKNAKNIILHITPLYRGLAYPTVFTLWIAKRLGFKTVVDLRAGSFIYYYDIKGCGYKTLMKCMVNMASCVTVEGSRYIKEIHDKLGYKGKITYFPNLVDCSKHEYTNRKSEKKNLFYFGRITANKGVDILLDLIDSLGADYHLYLAGGIAKDVDAKRIKTCKKITYLGILTSSELKSEMKKMHFFVFPTRHIGEGQSNSLIEAMAEGLIPVVADQGFCAEVVADCGAVLKQGSTASDYKNAIEQLAAGDLKAQGEKCMAHIYKCHNVETEIRKLIELYNKI